ncbi:MAG: efflux RND transporter periplasmic adaptor subunit [Rhodobacteraceae bacterium]|nr:efflux RND transporter periplasmic adaptor subunit [Paracoccaceae bacterium]MBR9820216.1 efflux RND transporter periplasmic adaptor subunit [Paracoccaceae bacterium]
MTDRPPSKRRFETLRHWLLVATILLGGLGYVFRHSLFPDSHSADIQFESPADLPMSVHVVMAERRAISRSYVAGGTLVGREEVLVNAQVSGVRLRQYLVDVGDRVTAGQVLALLDPQRIELQLEQSAADVTRAEAVIAQTRALLAEAEASARGANAEWQRARELLSGGGISDQTGEERKMAAEIGQARVDAQRAALTAAEADLRGLMAVRKDLMWQLERTTVRAPEPGIIAQRNARLGQTVSTDAEPLFRILKDGEIEMEASVMETAIHSLRQGQAVAVAIAGYDDTLKGDIRLVSPSVDPATRMGTAWIRLPGGAMKTGSYAQATFQSDRRIAVVVPRAAVLSDDEGQSVQVVRDGVIVLRRVVTGLTDASGIEIVDGLEQGEIVVAAAGGLLQAGSIVSPVPLVSASPDGSF